VNSRGSTFRQAGVIAALSILLALVYNIFAAQGIPLIRVAPRTEEVPDSVLFPHGDGHAGRTEAAAGQDTSLWKDIRVIAPLHERALHNPDSVRAVEQKKKEETVYRIISLPQLERLLKSRRGILFDARSEEDYRKGHITGARNVPGLDPGRYFEKLAQLPRDTLLIIYCNNPECHLGRSLAEFLSVLEFKNMVLYDDGWDGWEGAHMPVDTVNVEF
jgi:rhodanese-related sulfurtransferase